jgi:hypothetical protein
LSSDACVKVQSFHDEPASSAISSTGGEGSGDATLLALTQRGGEASATLGICVVVVRAANVIGGELGGGKPVTWGRRRRE